MQPENFSSNAKISWELGVPGLMPVLEAKNYLFSKFSNDSLLVSPLNPTKTKILPLVPKKFKKISLGSYPNAGSYNMMKYTFP